MIAASAPTAVQAPPKKRHQGMWELIRRLRYFSTSDLISYAMADKLAANTFIAELIEAKFAQVARGVEGFPEIFYLTDDPGAALPNEVHDQAWRSIRMLKSFTELPLLATVPAAASVQSLRKYLHALRKTGVLAAHVPKKDAGFHYRLRRDLGPLSSVLLSKNRGEESLTGTPG